MAGSPVTGTRKCYNSPNTCQDTANFAETTLTLRFGIATDYLPKDISCIPSMKSVSTKPQVLNPGESLGERESVTVSFNDHPHNDVGIDKYHKDRGFDPYYNGTFWAKFVARWPYIQGSALRIIRGFEGDAFEDMEIRHYIVEGWSGPDSNGNFSITAKDAIKLLDGDKAQAPSASNGVLNAGINSSATSATLSPSGIGNAEYPASGVASIGEEQITFTRVNDALTIVRGVESTAIAHDAGETVQLGISYSGQDAADIINDLITNYTDVPSSMIPLSEWQIETTTYIARLYTGKILKPTSVRDLVNELINQVGLVIYSDTVNQKIILRALRQFIPLSETDDNIIIEDSVDIDEQQDKRVSQVWTYIGQRNPLKSIDEEENFKTIVVTVASDSVAALEGRKESIRKIFSRWITTVNRAAAEGLNDIIIQRYMNAPRKFKYKLPITATPVLASAVTLSHRNLQNDEGTVESVIAQIISIEKTEAQYSIVAEEMTFTQEAVTDRLVVVDQNTYNFNLRDAHDLIYSPAQSGDTVTVVISSGVIVGSTSTSSPSFDVGSWAAGVDISITNNGRIEGKGGQGGAGGAGMSGKPGGNALYTRYAIDFDNTNGEIWGGGGGGAAFDDGTPASGSGGGGAGYQPGSGANSGTATSGGAGRTGLCGDGGDPGEDGEDTEDGTGGAAGAAINGDSFITFSDEGDILGPRLN